jgi:chaperone modulatory protein CbpM
VPVASSEATLDIDELAGSCGLSAGELQELAEYGALKPVAADGSPQGRFSAECAEPLRAAVRLRRDFDLDLFTMALLLDYLQRIETLERELRSLRTRLPASATQPSVAWPG